MSDRSSNGRDGKQSRSGWLLPMLVCVLLASPGQSLSQKDTDGQADAFPRLVRMVANADADAQQDFTWIALSELVASYEKVYTSSASEKSKKKKAREKLSSWRSGTQAYIAQLHRLMERFSGGVEIQIHVEKAGPPVIYIDDTPVIISGPEIGSGMQMERRIVDAYCAMYDCGDLVSSAGRNAATERVSSSAAGGWTLQNSGSTSYRTADGLLFLFSELSGRDEKQQACNAIAAELRELSNGLRDAALAGHWIEWDSIEIQPQGDGRGERVKFNSAQEFLRLPLPLLAQSLPYTPAMLTWLKQRAFDDTAEVEIAADPLLRRIGIIGDEQ